MLHNLHIRLSNWQLYITHNTNCMQESATSVPNKTLFTINCQMVVSQHFIAVCVLLVKSNPQFVKSCFPFWESTQRSQENVPTFSSLCNGIFGFNVKLHTSIKLQRLPWEIYGFSPQRWQSMNNFCKVWIHLKHWTINSIHRHGFPSLNNYRHCMIVFFLSLFYHMY